MLMMCAFNDPWRSGYISRLSLINHRRSSKRSTSFPFLNNARIARGSQAIRAKIRSDVKRIGIAPLDIALCLRQFETTDNKGFVHRIELAYHVCVGAAA